jgi:hypothetical protein
LAVSSAFSIASRVVGVTVGAQSPRAELGQLLFQRRTFESSRLAGLWTMT